jgi:uncharacterized membrane protein
LKEKVASGSGKNMMPNQAGGTVKPAHRPRRWQRNKMKVDEIIRNTARITGLASIGTIAAMIMYLRENDSGHTAISPYLALLVFVPSLILGSSNIITTRNIWKNQWGGVIPTLSGALEAAFLVYVDKANVLLQYETWIRRGMP